MPENDDDCNDIAVIKDPMKGSRVYHLPKEDDERTPLRSPRCGINYRHGEWTTVPVEDVPDDLDGCQRCPKASAMVDDETPSLLVRARRGDPEDFGLPS